MADEKGSSSNSEAAPITRRLTKLLSMPPCKSSFLGNLNIQPATTLMPPPLLPQTTAPPPAIHSDLHPIIKIMRDQELGKLAITIAVPVAITLLFTNNGNPRKLLVVHEIAAGLMIGSMATWIGILFRTTFPRFATILEQLGISLVLLFLVGLVASFLPRGFSLVIWLSGGLCLVPFIYAHIKR